jgi:pimeloyl-ACP methyl ester carboxylesterase
MSNDIAATHHLTNDQRPTVIALHCSGGTGSQWKGLTETLGDRFNVVAPDLYGCESTGHWNGERPFSLSVEAARVVNIIDEAKTPVHLIGHSYGGCVALRVAHERAGRIASLSLYEPAAFYLLKTAGQEGRVALKEITTLRNDIVAAMNSGAVAAAAARFLEYWSGVGAWAIVQEKIRAAMVRYIPKASREFHAALSERTPLSAYQRFNFPVLLLRGERGPDTTRLVVQQLAKAMRSPAESIHGAGHMGPITHAETVLSMIAKNLRDAESKIRASAQFAPA